MRFFLATLLTASGLALSARAGSNADVIPDPNPAVQLADFKVPEGYALNLFAADPMVRKPIQMNWDRRGRLWVVCSPLYPHIEPGAVANDEVIILEDTNHDGVADIRKVFADGLHIPTAVLPYGDGALVANSTELLWLHDRDGDDRVDPDGREVLFSGFGTEDTHHLLHTLRQGPDGKVYFMQSIYIHSHLETPFGFRRLLAGGVWMLDPPSGRIEVYATGFVNAWGLEFAADGEAFATDGAGGEGINHIFPGSNHVASKEPNTPVIPGLNPGQPKLCGLEIVGSSHFPPDWQGTLIANDFRGNRICRYKLEPSGSGYRSVQQADVLTTPNRAFRPVDVRFGPDGALYICDFYNPIIQHGEVDFRDKRRDHEHGRIWRLTTPGRPLVERPDLPALDDAALWKATASPDRWTAHFARVELASRGQAQAWRIEASDPREFALRRLMRQATTPDVWEASLPDSFADTTPRERRWWIAYASRGLQESRADAARRSVENLPRVLRVLDHPTDSLIDFSLSQYCRRTASAWLPALQGGAMKIENPDHLIYALKNSGDARALDLLVDPLLDGKLPPETEKAVWRLVGQQADAAFLKRIFDAAPAQGVGENVLDALIAAAEQRQVAPPGGAAKLGPWLEDAGVDAPLRAKAARLAGLWKAEPLRPALERLAAPGQPDALRIGAFQGLAALGGPAAKTVLAAAAAEGPFAPRAEATHALLRLDAGAAARAAVALLSGVEDGRSAEHLVTAFVQAKGGPAALAAALKDQSIPAAAAAAGMRVAGSGGLRDTALADAFRAAGRLQPLAALPDAAGLARLVERVHNEGDAVRGEAVYRRAHLLCAFCHAIGEAGGVIGPNLQSIGASAQVDYLIESLLDPTRKVKEGYHTTMITTRDGRVLAGLLVRDGDEVVVRDAGGTEHAVAKGQVEKREISPVSLMPPGLTASLAEPEFLDLVRFLSELGREGGVALPTARFVRTWQGRQADGSWRPVYAKVDGWVPLDDAPGGELKATITLPIQQNARFENRSPAQLTIDGEPFRSSPRPVGAGAHEVRLTWKAGASGSVRFELMP